MKIKQISFGGTFFKDGKEHKSTGVEITSEDAVIIAENKNGETVTFDIEEEADAFCTSFCRLHCEICPFFGKSCPVWS